MHDDALELHRRCTVRRKSSAIDQQVARHSRKKSAHTVESGEAVFLYGVRMTVDDFFQLFGNFCRARSLRIEERSARVLLGRTPGPYWGNRRGECELVHGGFDSMGVSRPPQTHPSSLPIPGPSPGARLERRPPLLRNHFRRSFAFWLIAGFNNGCVYKHVYVRMCIRFSSRSQIGVVLFYFGCKQWMPLWMMDTFNSDFFLYYAYVALNEMLTYVQRDKLKNWQI